MIDCFLGDAFGVLSCPFWSTVLQYDAWLPIHTLNLKLTDCVVRGASLLLGVCLSVTLRIVALWQYYVAVQDVALWQFKIRCNPVYPLCGPLPVPYFPVRVTRGAVIAYR